MSRSPATASARPTAAGFSLVELVFVIAITGIVAAIALPRFSVASRSYQVSLAAHRLATDLSVAKTRANYSSTSVTVRFDASATTYQIVGLPDPDRPAQTYTVNLAAEPYRVAYKSNSFGSQLTFDGYGTPGQSGTIALALGGLQATVVVDASTGRIFVQ